MESLLQDIRFALRSFAKSPGFLLVSILTLAIGIGLNGSIFSFVNMLLFRKLPLNLIEQPDRLVFLWSENQELSLKKKPASVDAVADWSRLQSFQKVTGGYYSDLTLTAGQTPIRLVGFRTTPDFFPLFGVQPFRGRGFRAEENLPGQDRVVVLSERAWKRYLGGDPQILDKVIRLDGIEHRVVGIMPGGFYMPTPNVDLFMPLGVAPGQRGRSDRFLTAVARLAPGISAQQAQTEMDLLSQRLASSYPEAERGWQVRVKPVLEEIYDDGVLLSAVILMIAVGMVLLLACASLGGMLLARAASRAREVALRCSLGADRGRLVRQLLTESTVLALLGGLAGVLLAMVVSSLMGRTASGYLALVGDVGVDTRTLLFMMGVSLLAALIFGLFPALQTSRPNLTEGLKEGTGKASTGLKGRRILDSIVVCEVALSLVLLVGAGLMVRTIQAWQEVSPGYDTSRLLTLRLSLPAGRYAEPSQVAAFIGRLDERLAGLPGVKGVAIGTSFPADQDKASRQLLREGAAGGQGEQNPWASVVAVSPRYLESLGVPLVSGRHLSARDVEGARPVAVISKVVADRYWSGQDPIGSRFRLAGEGADSEWIEIVGVAGPIEHYNVDVGPMPLLFVPLAQRPERALSVALRTSAAVPMDLSPEVQRAIAEVDPDQPLYDVQGMDAVISDNFVGLRVITTVLGFFGLAALFLAALGTYGVISYTVNQQTHEIGVRMALGALRSQVLRMILARAGRLALIGIAIGVVGSLGLSRLMSGLLFGVGAMDPVTFGGMAAVLLGVALLASFLPGLRASRIDPMITMRSQ